ncbi:hypothetical protein F4679DRAFT_581566 [Xylaria curta]|nr:hypothetical protein F4679DRAFT_581566 [Xylaria curta]
MSAAKQTTNEPIAVIGSACRFAGGATSPSKLWELLKEPRDVLREIPDGRFSAEGFYHPDASYHGRSNVKASYLIEDDVRAFDAQFFGIKPVEASAIDPQQRLLLETVYEALESAGQSMQMLRGSDTGVYAGQMCSDFEFLAYRDLDALPTYNATGTSRGILANRVSYFFDWHGPSMTLDTACSSSLYAVYLAAQALRAGESRAAVACGTNLLLGPEFFVSESKLNMLSPDSRSRMWDDAANGYARGDGVATVVLKTLSAALEDGDHIDCIIREVCVNQDGATSGITMPSAKAQAALIRHTYTKAGLDYLGDGRPQYVEAHGTGTPAGDPIEAEALSTAFFPDRAPEGKSAKQQPLYVGSIKTVLGHTEGTAGLAALIKASLAVQHGVIPPNMLFNRLNPKIEPFYHSLEVPTSIGKWPVLPTGQPRRASINSFGFGGANAHAVVENYIPETQGSLDESEEAQELPLGPYVFSAASEQSLVANLNAYSLYLAGPDATTLNPRNLAWTLRQRRSTLPFKVALPAGSIGQLKASIDAKLDEAKSNKTPLGLRTSILPQSKPRLLAIFTGQGAQYARMGAELLDRSCMARKIIAELEAYLAALPESERPSWSLEQELRAPQVTSRLNEAALSQPLCTALQIVQVDLLRAAGVELAGAVGHSSGEIGAAYAAGFLSARDALLVAYFRGLHASSAASPNGADIQGAMMAVGTSMEDAADILAEFEGAATLAACNSSASVTLSGDQDAIDELATIFEDEKKFHRKLRVDKAYHSSHMVPCSAPYIESLRASGVRVRAPDDSKEGPVWYSTVYEDLDMSSPEALAKLQDGSYWADNMVRPVLLYQGLHKALASDTFDLAIEIGPHPALKGPVTQTIQEALEREMPYHGVLARGTAADVALSAALGFLWSQESTARTLVDLESFEAAATAKSDGYRVLKGLPTYQWNHERSYWKESRHWRRLRTRKVRVNPILGAVEPESSMTQQRWRNILREREIEWLSGHQLQGRTVFPAAGYVSTLIEAARELPHIAGSTIRLIDISSFHILQAMSGEDDDGIEILVTLENIRRDEERQSIRAHFTYSSTSGRGDPDAFAPTASADVEILLGEPSKSLLPARQADPPNLVDVTDDRFYDALTDLGYGYTGPFRALSSLRRKLGKAVAQVAIPPSEESRLLIHPGTLDGAIQAVLLAFCHPGDGQMWSLHVPTFMERIRVNPTLCGPGWGEVESVHVAASMSEADGPGMVGDIDIFAAPGNNSTDGQMEHAAIQVEGVRTVPFAGATAADDDKMFGRMRWANGSPDGDAMVLDAEITPFERDLVVAAERAALYYLRKFERDLAPDHFARSHPTYSNYLAFGRRMNELLGAQGRYKKAKLARQEWANDTWEDILAATEPFKDYIDVRIIHKVGEVMSRIFDGEEDVVPEQPIPTTGLLEEYHANAVGLGQSGQWLARGVKQLVHRYPNMNILEVGAGTGAATRHILSYIGAQGFSSYTYTDISANFFAEAASVFAPYKKRMTFKTLDAARDPASQGYPLGSYDLIVASCVIHATRSLEQTLRNLRRLLRPGGFLIVNESTSSAFARDGFILGTMPNWWSGVDEGRTLSPFVGPEHWDEVLRNSGFSGIDTMTPEAFQETHSNTVFVSQAVDDTVLFLREPLSAPVTATVYGGVDRASLQDLIIIGGSTLRTGRLVSDLKRVLGSHVSGNIDTFKTLLDLPADFHPSPDACVLSISELDSAVFEDLTSAGFDALKRLVAVEHTLLWVTRGKLAGDPAASMSVGFLRTAIHEVPGLRVQCIDLDPGTGNGNSRTDASLLAEALLRFRHLSQIQGSLDAPPLWSMELEIAVDAEGRQLVPRFMPDADANDRFNSARRTIRRQLDVREAAATLGREKNGDYQVVDASLLRDADQLTSESGSNAIELHATSAIISPVNTPLGPLFLTLGLEEDESVAPGDRKSAAGPRHVLALAESLTSRVRVPNSATARLAKQDINIVSSSGSIENSAKLLVQVAANLFAESALQGLVPGQKIAFHNATGDFTRVLRRRAAEQCLNAIFTTTSTEAIASENDDAISIPAFMPAREIRALLPRDLARFVVVSPQDPVAERIAAVLPVNCRVERLTAFHGKGSSYAVSPYRSTTESAYKMLGGALQRALAHAQEDLKTSIHVSPVNTVSTSDLTATAQTQPKAENSKTASSIGLRDPLAVLDWQATPIVQARINRLDSKPIFKADRTYWLVGLSRGLGLSICDWMITKGAKYVVISSRSPDVEASWEKSCRNKGAVVKIFANDITDGHAVETLYQTICDTLPPLAGVMMGAMVLRDRLIRDMTFEEMKTVLGPKVDGSHHLDRVLGDLYLDFFVYFSSMMQVLGNLGQANYATANASFSGFATRRRKRGLAASVVDIGAVSGAGVFAREAGDGGDNSLLLAGLRRISEVDVHQVLAEAINSGYGHLPLEPGEEPAIGVGMRFVSPGEPSLPRWFGNPKFAGYILRDEDEDADRSSTNRNASMQEKLLRAQSKVQVFEAIRDSFLAMVRPMLQIEGADDDSLMRMRSDEIGMDSLIAVGLRSWFLKQLSVSIPVLRILNGVSIGELVEEAVAKISPELAPGLVEGGPATASSLPVRDFATTSIAPPSRPRSAGSSVPSSSSSDAPGTGTVSRMSDETVLTPPPEAVTYLSLPNGEKSHAASLSAAVQRYLPIKEEPAGIPVLAKSLTLERSLSLSHTQSMFWVIHSLLEDKTTLNHTGFVRITGRVRVQDLKVAVQQLSGRHESMRACFYLDENNKADYNNDDEAGQGHMVVQGILKTGRTELEHVEIRNYDEVEEEFDRLKSHVYDLSQGEFMRIILLTRTGCPTENYLMIGAHHINFDGMCTQTLFRDLEAFYTRRAHLTLSPTVKHFSSFIASEREDEMTGAWDGDLAFWRREFATVPEPLPLTRARVAARKPLLRYDVHRVDFRLDPSLAERVRAVARQHRVTAFHFYLAAFRVVLQRFLSLGVSEPSQQDGGGKEETGDICIGIADSNRHDEETLGSLGPYVNLLALRFRDRPPTFASALASARDKTFAALGHAAVPFDAVLRALRVPRDVSYAPLFQAFLDYRLGFPSQQPFADCTLEMMRFEPGRTAYDLSVDIIDTPFYNDASAAGGKGGGDALLSVFGQAALYKQEDVQIFAACFEDLIREFADKPSKSLVGPGSEWSYRDADVAKTLELSRGPVYETQWTGKLAQQLDDMVAAHADKTAIKLATGGSDGDSLTYKELDEKTNAIATALIENGVSRGQYVAVYQEPTPDWVCSMLAILRIGAVYVPLDPGTPASRLAMVVATCHPTALLVDRTTGPNCAFEVPTVIEVSTIPTSNLRRMQAVPEAHDPAIALHTSGTTGTPKVIVLTHANIAYEIETSVKTYGVDSNVTVLQQSAFGFDMSVLQILLAVALGGALVMVPREFRGDAVAITDFIVKHNVTWTCATPTEYSSWFRHGDCAALQRSQWTVAVSGGEAFSHSLLDAFREHLGAKSDMRLINAYGPAETTCCSASIELALHDGAPELPATIPAGPACPNESIYILDEMRPLPLGLPGEICIGGVAVSNGYLGNEALTSRAFVRNPFAPEEYIRKGWTTMFRTGDRGRLLPDGSLVVEGRIGDGTQIKIRGVRIDLRDIEQTIIQASEGAIAEAVAVARTTSNSSAAEITSDSKFIVGYVVFNAEFLNQQPLEGPADATSRGQAYLARLLAGLPLPRTVCPSMLIPIDKVPLTTSGKMDRRSLAALPLDRSSSSAARRQTEQMEPLTELELRTEAIWDHVLNLEGDHLNDAQKSAPLITRDTDFFHVGGTSMLLLEMREQIKKQLGLSVPLMQLFEHSTLGAMATLLAAQEAKRAHVAAWTDIDWESEATPSDELRKLAQTCLPRSIMPGGFPQVEAKTVVLTGASGILGRQVLERLLAAQQTGGIGKIICIALRRIESRIASGVLPAPTAPGTVDVAPQLIYQPGDLRQRRLGLTPAEWASIAAQADAIVHVGAEVSHTKTYATLRSANVAATAELTRLCLEAQIRQGRRRPVPFHFVSTGEIAMLGDGGGREQGTLYEESVRSAQLVPDQEDAAAKGYAATKWVCERMLENLSEEIAGHQQDDDAAAGPLRVWIHRPSSITTPQDESAVGPDAPILPRVLFYSRLLRAVPEEMAAGGRIGGSLDFVPLDTVAGDIVDSVIASCIASCDEAAGGEKSAPAVTMGVRSGRGGVTYVHHSGGTVMELATLREFLETKAEQLESVGEENQKRAPFEALPFIEWTDRAEAAGLHPLLAGLFRGVEKQKKTMIFPRFIKGSR